jgi:hypothetical protein
MKKIITLLIPILFSIQLVSAQKTYTPFSLSPQALRNFYMQKSKTKTMAGLVLLIAGIAMANEEIKINASQSPSSHPYSGGIKTIGYNKKSWLLFFGKAITLSSIPFFISACRKKEQASRIENRGYSHW